MAGNRFQILLNRLTSEGGQVAPGLASLEPGILKLPPDYGLFLQAADGLIWPDDSLQILSWQQVLAWNRADWRRQFASLCNGLLLVAQDAFGDQYGYDLNGSIPSFVKFYCEGGGRRVLVGIDVFTNLIKAWDSRDSRTEFDWAMYARAAGFFGQSLSVGKHLAFSLPLVVGGDYALENLGLEPSEAHLHVLGQLSAKNLGLPDGRAIRRFDEDT